MSNNFKKNSKRIIGVLLCICMLASLTACGESSDYQAYVRSIIKSNYLGITDEYIKMTGANEEDAEAIYLQNVTRLADNLSAYYGLEISGDPELAPAMVDLAKQIYGKAKFDVGKAYKDNNINYVDVTIYPIDILNQTNADVIAYVQKFNTAVEAGEYNDYTKEEYEYEFASGIIGILAGAVSDIDYAEPETIQVRIILSDDSYYIGNEDVKNIDRYIISTDITQSFTDATPLDATGTGVTTDDASPSDSGN